LDCFDFLIRDLTVSPYKVDTVRFCETSDGAPFPPWHLAWSNFADPAVWDDGYFAIAVMSRVALFLL